MASNFFGQLFRITTFGESHGPAIGVVIDGCPAGVLISTDEIQKDLLLRSPGQNPYTTMRKEKDLVEILSGVFDGVTTGAPIALLIRNVNQDGSAYAPIKHLYRPGHANFTYLEKYGVFDHFGGGRSSARETAARVAAGSIAKKLLSIDIVSYVSELGGIEIKEADFSDLKSLREKTYRSPIFCPDPEAEEKMREKIEEAKAQKDSIGGIISCRANIPPGLGDPVYGKLEANLAFAMLSIPATKGFEIGEGFQAARMKGSEHNDPFDVDENGKIYTKTNFSGGVLGGISTGAPLFFRVAFKPTSSIKKAQESVNLDGKREMFQIPETGKHDPCVIIRAVPVIEAMCAIVLADALLMNRCSRLFYETV